MGIIGKTADAIKVIGELLVTAQTDRIILGSGMIAHYQLIITRFDERDELELKAELKDESIDRQKLENEISSAFQKACHLRLERVDFLVPGTFPENYQRILDERKAE
jgi:phenylacetate-coenzyme A ligase PaaK-like adenylate-forming protein